MNERLAPVVGALTPPPPPPPPNIVTPDSLYSLGWGPHKLHWFSYVDPHPSYGKMRKFDVLGTIPASAGVYLFGLDFDDDLVDLRYAGETECLRMVTHGENANGQFRGPNRYGRPNKGGGDTRQWVNSRLTQATDEGRTAFIWVNSRLELAGTAIRKAIEKEMITRHQLLRHQYGWNRRL